MSARAEMSPDDLAGEIAILRWAMKDALHAAASIASRASEHLSGTEGAILFEAARRMIADLDDHPAAVALNAAAIRPSLLAKTVSPKAGMGASSA